MSSKKKILAGVVGVGALVFVGALAYALIPTDTRDIGPGQQVAAGSAEEKQLIEAGQLKPGARYPTEKVITEEFGVSRTVVREAFARLAARGLLVSRMDHAESVGGVVEGVEQGIVVQAGQGVDRVEAVAQEGFDRGFGGTETWHGDDL